MRRARLGRRGRGHGRIRSVRLIAALTAGVFAATVAPAGAQTPTWTAHGSAEQVYVTGLGAGERMSLLKPNGRVLHTQNADSLGGLLFVNVPPGGGYRVRVYPRGDQSGPITVMSDQAAPPSTEIYNQSIPAGGYGYITMRDGIQLAIDVHPPLSPAGLGVGLPQNTKLPDVPIVGPPYPTLIEYSGYGYADPAGPQSGIAVLANLMGFAVVDVNMRGTGCSGGAYNYFEALQNLDAYDVIETIAHQPWVLGHKVGMMGISFGAISQLFAAQLDPPDLEAISPLSTIDATATTLYPGGILNTGFAVQWAQQRQNDAAPAGPNAGQSWAYQRIQQGDQTCKQNQVLHGEAPNLLAKVRANAHYVASVADSLDPVTFVNKINVPVFMACQWEDEQTGGHCADLAEHFTSTQHKWFTFTNGAHIDSLDPETFDRWYDFLELFVAHQSPILHAAVLQGVAGSIYDQAMGITGLALPIDPVQLQLTYAAALRMFEAQPEVRILFDNGAGASPLGVKTPGDPYPGFVRSFPSFPIPGTTARTWYLAPGGALADQPSATNAIDWFRWNAHALPLADYGSNTSGGGLWGNASNWQYDWAQNPPGSAISYVTAPLTANQTVIGAGAVHLWVRSSTRNVDLQATISEVRPDGKETFVQNGWIQADERKLATGTDDLFHEPSTLLDPIPSELASDVKAMPRKKFVEVVIPLYYEGHVYRAGSRIRVTISAPNGTQPIWSFSQTTPNGPHKVSIELSPRRPSSLILPVVPGVSVPTPLPPCPSLRNEPCRPYVPIANRTATH